MLLRKFYVLVLVFFFCSGIYKLEAQDSHFSQISATSIFINPANTGNFNGDWRAGTNYRSQWKSIAVPYITLLASYEKQIYLFNQKFSAGGYILNDQSGSIDLSTTKIFGSVAYHKKIGGHKFHFGIQPGFVYRAADRSSYIFGDQWDMTTGRHNADIFSAETVGERRGFFDLNTGLVYSYPVLNFVPEIGIGLFNVNVPKESTQIEEIKHRVPFKQVYTAGVDIPINNTYSAIPRFMYMREKKAVNQLIGSDFYMKLPANEISLKHISAGLYFRDAYKQKLESFIVILGCKIDKVSFALNYDINISQRSQSSAVKGAFELSIIYTELSTVFNQYTLPCIRY